MKRLFTLIFCFILAQIVKADPAFIAIKTTAADTIVVPIVNQPAPLGTQSSMYKRRLDSIKKDVPLDYNEYVQSYIDLYMHNRDEMGKVLGATKYYFPIYEKALRDAGIPDEIKYLSIVESKLDPLAISRVGATGPWQFMANTAKTYGLNMDDYVDDRRDPIQASYAAAAYLKDAYEEFGDWLLAIASYNCGKSNVERAIEKAGSTNFWEIRQYLPNETRGYVPAFIAVNYVMRYYNKHNIVPQACTYTLTTDTVLVNKYIALNTVSTALGIDLKQLADLNPAYKRQIINGTVRIPRRLIIPQVDKGRYAALYDALNNNSNIIPVAPRVAFTAPKYYDNRTEELPTFHKVKHGETLSDIADTYGIELADLKAMNHLSSGKLVPGQRVRLTSGTETVQASAMVKHADSFFTYKVKTGDTLTGIASKFDGASVEKIRSINGLKKDQLQPGMTIKINRG
jgi:membrane-bound lytic murein transglycosylase D